MNQVLLKFLIIYILIGFSANAIAQEANYSELNELTSSSTDYGQGLLNFVTFGQFTEPTSSEQVSMLSTVSRIICVIALYMMAALSIFAGINYVIHTANKGVPGGQVISSFWMPVRIAVSTLLLIPLSSGFATIQIKGVYNIASTGNAHGSYLASKIGEHLITHGAYNIPTLKSNVDVINGLVASELCMIRVNAALRKDVVSANIRQYQGRAVLSYDKDNSTLVGRATTQQGYCGTVEVTIPRPFRLVIENDSGEADMTNPHNRMFATYENQAELILANRFPAIINDWRVEARKVAANIAYDEAALKELQVSNNLSVFQSQASQEKTKINDAATLLISLYGTADQRIQTEIASLVASVRGAQTESGKPLWKEELDTLGWTYLGTIYWQSTKNTELTNEIGGGLSFSYIEPYQDDQFAKDERTGDLMRRYKDMVNVVNTKGYTPPTSTSAVYNDIGGINDAGNSGSGFYKKFLGNLTQSIALSLVVDDETDMVSQLQTTGNYVGSFVDNAYHLKIFMIAGVEAGKAAALDLAAWARTEVESVPFVGALFGPAGAAVSVPAIAAATFIASLAGGYSDLIGGILPPLLLASFLLAIVLPAIPLFYWTMGIVSWILFYIECLLVSPIWLAAHGTAEKEGWGTEHTRQGYMLMIGLYLNPIMRTAGFAAILVTLYPLGTLVRWFSNYLVGVITTGFLTSPLMIAGSMLILAFLGYAIANRVFSLPNELFEKGLRWVNGGQEVTGDENATSKVNAMITNFGYKAEGGMRSSKQTGANSAKPTDPSRARQ
jgi:conjugal transfer/type IV secretion protein DotA/TraY|tara:strand:+ start:79468 stop:81816 length:2349 start_codon:yes stop_codon:yes gene_type:complete